MDGGSTIELVLLNGGRADDACPDDSRPRPDLRVVRSAPSELQASLEETVAAARTIRRDIEARIAGALDELVRARPAEPEARPPELDARPPGPDARAPEPDPR